MDLEKIRAVRANPEVRLKPTPYLKASFFDEYGDEQKVVVRNYQAQGIINLCMVSRMVLGDDTGLGKTLEVLSAIGYVWLLEPEYVPIVVTRKSSLFQWDRETHKFMQGMESVVVDGEPYERDAIYKAFFEGHEAGRKRLLVMTYDMFLKDAEKSVVRDRGHKPSREAKRALRDSKEARKPTVAAFEAEKAAFKARFDTRDQLTKLYLVERLKPADPDAKPPPPPREWSEADEEATQRVLRARDLKREADLVVARAKDVVEPPVVAPGIQARLAGFRASHPEAKVMLVLDEVHVAKDYQGKLHKILRDTAATCERVVGMTATPVKNRLMEFFSIFRVVNPHLFPKVTHFHRDFCHVKMQKIGGGKQVPIVIGHSKEQLEAFNAAAEAFYLSRRKSDVAKELPELVSREIICQLSPEQDELYGLAELELEEKDEDPDADRTQMLKSMTMVQQASNAPQLLMDDEGNPFEGESSKLEQLVEVLQENPDSKVLVFSRFEKMISLIESRLKKEKIRCCRITGKEKSKERADNVAAYQSPTSGVNVLLITTAGTESLNLQATEQIVLIDNPWSWGDYVQLTGRAVRIGSKNLTVVVTHLVARRRDGDKTIDDYVLKALRSKKRLADTVAGEALKGGLEFVDEDVVNAVVDCVREAKKLREAGKDVREEVRRIHSASKKKQTLLVAKKKASKSAPIELVELAVVDFSDLDV